MTYTICLEDGKILYTTEDKATAYTKLEQMADIYTGHTVDLWLVNFLGKSSIEMSTRH